MGRRAITLSLATVVGCSFVDDFDKFRPAEDTVVPAEDGGRRDADPGDATGETRQDAAVPLDAASEAGPAPVIDSSTPVVDAGGPPLTCGDVVCDDGDPCTRDTCAAAKCVATPIDADGDGYSPGTCKLGSSARGGDCDDTKKDAHPGATEVCDELDNDCNGKLDDGFTKIQCYPDPDRDDFPNLDGVPVAACTTCPEFTVAVADPSDRSQQDCWDDPKTFGDRVYPGQTSYQEEGYGPGGKNDRKWDFDCNGMVDRQYQPLAGCAGLLGLICDSSFGFVGDQPECGESGSFQTCRQNGLTCSGTTESKKQLCK